MAKYKFIKPFSERVTVGGAVGLSTKSFNVGDVVEGEKIQRYVDEIGGKKPTGAPIVRVRIAPHSPINEGAPSNMSYQEFLDIPIGNLQEVGMSSMFTPKNIIIGLLAIGVIVGGLKLAKVF